MSAMLHCLVGEVADAVRAALPPGPSAANDESNLALVETLSRRGLLDAPALMALLVRRADEERIGATGRARSGRREARTIQGLVSNDDGAVSAAAMVRCWVATLRTATVGLRHSQGRDTTGR